MGLVKTFWVELHDTISFTYESKSTELCPLYSYGHKEISRDYIKKIGQLIPGIPELAPERCKCGYHFKIADKSSSGMRGWSYVGDNKIHYTKLEPGAMFIDKSGCMTEGRECVGYDGLTIVVVLPDGTYFYTDARSSNCTRIDDNEHRCWVRNFTLSDDNPSLTKDGNTCSAGSGSIVTDKWHGLLRDGYLITLY